MVAALGTPCHMPAERFGSAGFDGRHHFELAETDMTRIGLPICRPILPKDVSYLQPWARQPPESLFQPSPHGMILQLFQHLVGADGAADGFGGDMGIPSRCTEL